jgi:hypothetical protein
MAAESEDAASQWHLFGGAQEDHGTVLVRNAKNQYFGAHRPDLTRWEVGDRYDERPEQLFGPIVRR